MINLLSFKHLCVLLVLAAAAGAAAADEDATDVTVERLTQHYFSGTPLRARIVTSHPVQYRAAFREALSARLGPLVGYKVALTGAAARKRFAATSPAVGLLYEKMLLQSPARLPAAFAARALVEADLIVRVGSEDINHARTDRALLACLDRVAAFIELPDMLFAPQVKVDATQLELVNMGARYGVMGAPVALGDMDDAYRRLADIEVVLEGDGGLERRSARATVLLGHPLNVVRWLRGRLAREGIRLRVNDWLSLGSLTAPQALGSTTRVRARYTGLVSDSVQEVIVNFY